VNKSIFERSLNIGSIFSFEFLKGKSDKKRHHEFCPTRTNGISEFGFEQKINVKLEKVDSALLSFFISDNAVTGKLHFAPPFHSELLELKSVTIIGQKKKDKVFVMTK
jgi:hypothetical protein